MLYAAFLRQCVKNEYFIDEMMIFHLTNCGNCLIIESENKGGVPVSMTEKCYIGVIAAEVNSIEQRQIMKGVIAEGQELRQRIVVFSNIYNSYEYDQSLDLENNIYELMFSQELCGLIMMPA